MSPQSLRSFPLWVLSFSAWADVAPKGLLPASVVPSAVFVQAGHAPRTETHTLTLGLVWPKQVLRTWSETQMSLHWELAVGRWSAHVGDDRVEQWVSQFSLTPTLRWSSRGNGGWFGELGIGANLITPVYRAESRRFSTTFNFGDHLALGYRWEDSGREVALRIEHFSNGGIRRPNPGEDFLQLRWVQPF